MKQKMYSCDARVILSILIGLFLSCNVFAQDVTIKGNVKDAKGEPIIGASILEKGTTNGTVTDFDGNFMLSAPKGSTIGISYIGYKLSLIHIYFTLMKVLIYIISKRAIPSLYTFSI